MKLIVAVINNSKESRKEYLRRTFAVEGKKSSSNFNPQVFGNTKIIPCY